MPDTKDLLVLTTTFTCNNIFYKAALAETISWDGHLTGTYDVLLQSAKGTNRLTLITEGGHWRAGDEIEQVGIVQKDGPAWPGDQGGTRIIALNWQPTCTNPAGNESFGG